MINRVSSIVAQIPNILTLSRIAAAPVLILLLRDENYELAVILFVLAGITDGLDGWIAKRYGFTSQLGARLDPLADKIIILSAYIMLTILGDLAFWLVTLVIFRDLIIVGGYLVLTTLDGHVQMQPTMTSKINTVAQIVLVIAVLSENTAWLSTQFIGFWMTYTVAVLTIVSGAQYVWVWAIRRYL